MRGENPIINSLVLDCCRAIRGGKPYSLFALSRDFILPKQDIEFGNYHYSQNQRLRKRFDRYLADEEFAKMDYTDIYAGPLKPEERMLDCDSWAEEVSKAVRMKEPKNLVFYLRQEHPSKKPPFVAARVLIPTSDFIRTPKSQRHIPVSYGAKRK
jgi:hypothetical protein